jgi:hypothetical protein
MLCLVNCGLISTAKIVLNEHICFQFLAGLEGLESLETLNISGNLIMRYQLFISSNVLGHIRAHSC